MSVPVPDPMSDRLERLTNLGLHGLMSKSLVAGMALQAGVALLENIYLGKPLPETLEPMGTRLRPPGRPPKRPKPLPPGAKRFEDFTPEQQADLARQRPDLHSFEDVESEPPTPTDADRAAFLAGAFRPPEELAKLANVTAENTRQGVAELKEKAAELGVVLADDPSQPTTEESAQFFKKVMETPPLADVPTHTMSFHESEQQPGPKAETAFGEHPDDLHEDIAELVPTDGEPPAPRAKDPFVCEHGVRLDAKVSCIECSPFAN